MKLRCFLLLRSLHVKTKTKHLRQFSSSELSPQSSSPSHFHERETQFLFLHSMSPTSHLWAAREDKVRRYHIKAESKNVLILLCGLFFKYLKYLLFLEIQSNIFLGGINSVLSVMHNCHNTLAVLEFLKIWQSKHWCLVNQFLRK